MKSFIEKHKKRFFLFLIYGVVFLVGYLSINAYNDYRFNTGQAEFLISEDLQYDFEKKIPFIPEWNIIYLYTYPYIVLPLFTIFDKKIYKQTVYTLLSVAIMSFIFFILFPSRVDLREPAEGTGFIKYLMDFTQSADKPNNCLPSHHIAASVVITLFSLKYNRKLGIFTIAISGGITLSVLFLKQHYFLDIVSGIAVALIWYFFWNWKIKRDENDPKLPDTKFPKGVIYNLGIFVVFMLLLFIGYLIDFQF